MKISKSDHVTEQSLTVATCSVSSVVPSAQVKTDDSIHFPRRSKLLSRVKRRKRIQTKILLSRGGRKSQAEFESKTSRDEHSSMKDLHKQFLEDLNTASEDDVEFMNEDTSDCNIIDKLFSEI